MDENQTSDRSWVEHGQWSLADAIRHLSLVAEQSGIPSTYVSLKHTVVEYLDRPPRERLLVDLETADVGGEFRENGVVSLHESHPRVSTSRLTMFRSRTGSVERLLSVLKEEGFEELCKRSRWFEHEGLLTGDLSYYVDPANEWPIWSCLVGCDISLPESDLRHIPDEDLGVPRQLSWETKLSDGTLALMPFVALRLKQDLIRLGDGWLRTLANGSEEAVVLFKLGTMGWNFALSNSATLNYRLLGADQEAVGSGNVTLTDDHFRNGVHLSVPPEVTDKRIFGTDLKLLLNNTVVDRSLGAYIRSIKLNVEVKSES